MPDFSRVLIALQPLFRQYPSKAITVKMKVKGQRTYLRFAHDVATLIIDSLRPFWLISPESWSVSFAQNHIENDEQC
ncbi:hypothetical protein Y032_0643g1058 [Ancylostoma ceylanicum]|uniref:Uncharacterized protein n=1 Tax=Ancylostoma ceylanicum TaxID=53326 RepID=A0A016WL16_9BILA|nr:hypothetical protein Y032_0643g1058 [Ancylostoma ceylanicum]